MVWDDDIANWKPHLGAVRFDEDGLSTFVLRLLQERGLDESAVADLGGTRDDDAIVYAIGVGEVLDLAFTVSISENDDTPIGFAHASVFRPAEPKPDTKQRALRLTNAMTLVHGAITLPKPDGA